MNKKFLNAVLFGALIASSTGTFTSCKDYDDDINGLQEQIDKSGSTVEALQTQLATLQSAATAAQTAAEAAKTAAAEAKTAAEAAKAAGDTAKAEAATAKALAEEAKAAAAQAKADAIAEAAKQVEALRNSMQVAIDKKVDLTVYEAAVKAIGARIDGIELGLSNLANGAVKENANAIKDAQDAIETMIAADQDLQSQLDALKLYAEGVKDIADANAEDIKTAQDAILAAQEEIKKQWDEMNNETTGLKALIAGNKSDIAALTKSTANDINDLKDNITDELDAIKGDITAIQGDIRRIDGLIRGINTDLASLHTLMTCRLSSITFAPDYIVDGVEAIKFNSLKYAAMAAGENTAIPTVEYKFSTAALATASYHFNPASFKLVNADYSYIDRSATEINTRVAASQWVEISGTPVANVATGTVDFKLLRLNVHSTQPADGKTNLVALQATLKGDAVDKGETGVVVTGGYVKVYDAVLDAADVRVADKKTLVAGTDAAHYATTFNACKAEMPRYKMSYDKVFDLKELVATCFGNGDHREFPIDDYKLSYKFSVASTAYDIPSDATVTDQQKWIVCNDAKAGLYQAEGFNKEASGRTPILKVELIDEAGNVVRRGFVKVEIGVTKQEDLTIGGAACDLVVKCNDTAAEYTISEQFIRENLYRIITNGKETGMSHEEFWNLYEASSASAKVLKNNTAFGMSTPQIVAGATDQGTATKKIVWKFTHGELGKINAGGSAFVGTVTVKNKLSSSEYPANITFKFTVNVKLPEFNLAKVENNIYWKNDKFQVNVEVPESVTESAATCVFNRNLTNAYSTYNLTGLPECVSSRYVVTKTYANGTATSTPMTGVKINGNMISLDKNNAAVKSALNSENGLQATVAHIYTLNSGDEITVNEFMVNFIRPVNLNMPSGVTVMDAKTGGDIANFQWNGLLTDWRGEAITAPSWISTDDIRASWNKVCVPEYTFADGHYNLVSEAILDVQTGIMKFTTTTTTQMFTGSATYQYSSMIGGKTKEKTYTVSEPMLTKAEVAAELDAMALKGQPAFYKAGELQGEIQYVSTTVSENTEVEYTYVKSVNYTPAKYEWIPGAWVVVPHNCTDMPNEAGTVEGQTMGCWKWMTLNHGTIATIVQGQYWDYYGAFGAVVADVTKATTSLEYNGHKLPDGATLAQIGNTVKYVNVNSPIDYSYQIFIPATVSYGWGTASSKLTITVNPKN